MDDKELTMTEKKEESAEEALNAVKADSLLAFRITPEKDITAEMCLAAVKQNGEALQYVPEELRTAELCLAAVQDDGMALAYVPEELQTAELRLTAVKQEQESWHFIAI
jgi:hypothetical protein